MENFLRAELPCREALFERIARQSFDITCVLGDAIAPEIFAHELDRILYGHLRPGQRDLTAAISFIASIAIFLAWQNALYTVAGSQGYCSTRVFRIPMRCMIGNMPERL